MLPTYWKDSPLLSQNSLEKLDRFTKLILQWNAKINLTGFDNSQEIEDVLIGESVLAAESLQSLGLIRPGVRVLDFGSGAGIPGMVWGTLELPIQVTSLEIRQKKIAFQKEAARQLGLAVKIHAGRFPDAIGSNEFDLIVSRAIRYDPGIWTDGERCLAVYGSFVRFAPANAQEEGWNTIAISERSSLLVKTVSKDG
jgi:16S rRNA (guanine527-N7)-methyltransferase